MYVIVPNMEEVPVDPDNFKHAYREADAIVLARAMAKRFPDNEIHIFQLCKKVKAVGQPTFNVYNVNAKGEVTPA